MGTQLELTGLPLIQWMGMRGMTWDQLLPVLAKGLKIRGCPDVLVIHLGDSDWVSCPAIRFLAWMVDDLSSIQTLLPGARLVWADMLPRRVWRDAWDPKAIDLARRKMNKLASRMFRWRQGVVIKQPGIYYSSPYVFRGDGVHLFPEGLDIYLENMASGFKSF